jgi:hypothetical protein
VCLGFCGRGLREEECLGSKLTVNKKTHDFGSLLGTEVLIWVWRQVMRQVMPMGIGDVVAMTNDFFIVRWAAPAAV